MILSDLTRQEIQVNSTKKLVVIAGWCKACGICMDLCRRGVLGTDAVTKKVILLKPELCNGCGLCELSCPDYVFTIEELEAVFE
jgi:2-oxoglutarate ferredoxin oxidoreductase subunit delta